MSPASAVDAPAAMPRSARPRVLVPLLLWVAAVAVALQAQRLLVPLNRPEAGVIAFAIATVLCVISMRWLERRAPLPEPAPAPVALASMPISSGTPTLLFVVAGGAIAAAVYAVAATHYHLAIWLWLGGMALAMAALALGTRHPFRWPRLDAGQWTELLVIAAIVAVALALRLPDLTHIPPEVHGDEAACGLEARRILRGEVANIFGVGWYHIPYVSFAISSLFMRLFGDDLYGFRLGSVVLGTLSIVLAYLIVRRLFSARIATIAALLLAFNHWHVHFSRSGINYMQALFAAVLLFHFFLRGLESRRALDFLIAGFAAGLCFDVYYGARLAPVLVALYALYRTLTEREFLTQHFAGFVALLAGTVMFLAPMGVVYARAPEVFISRTNGVLVFSPDNRHHVFGSYQTDSMAHVLEIQAINSLRAFNTMRGETSLQYGHTAPLLDFWSGALFVIGAIAFTLWMRRSRYFFIGIWFWLTLVIGGMLTIDSLFSPRVITIIPVLFVFPALVLDGAWRGAEAGYGRAGRYAFGAVVVAFLVLAARANYLDYFQLHIQRLQPAGFNTTLSRFVLSINDRYRVYLIGRPDTSLRYDTEHFLLPDVDGVDVRAQPLPLPLNRVPADKGVGFLIEFNAPDAAQRLASITQAYPGGREEVHSASNGIPLFYSYLVDHAALMAANPQATLDHESIPALLLSQVNGAKS